MTSRKSIRSQFAHSNRFLSAAVLAVFMTSPTLFAQNLPELSDSAALVMNNDQEKIFGKQVMLNIRSQSRFSEDIMLIEYFTRLSEKLASHSPRDFGKLSVAVAVDPAINAFAVPGGYITANTGLITNTRSEAELASVLAHEIGHQSQRHIARSIERSKQLSIPAAAALLGGLLIGGEAGKAAIISSQAAVAGDRLSYSRTFEREADATGMNIMAAAGFDPNAMPSFFNQLENQSRLYGGIVVEFLSTHPVSSDRIADGRSRASRIQAASQIIETPADRLDFAHAKARTLALYGEPAGTVIKQFELDSTNMQQNQYARQVAAYGLSIGYIRNQDFTLAANTIRQLRQQAPDNPLYQLAEAELAYASGQTARAAEAYGDLYESDSSHPGYIAGYTLSLIQAGDNPAAIRLMRKTLRHRPEMGWAYGLLEKAYSADGKILNALFTRAQRLKNVGLYTQALELLNQQLSRSYPDSSEYLTASINSLIKQLEEEKRQLDNFDL